MGGLVATAAHGLSEGKRDPEMLVDAGLMTAEVRQSFRNNTGVQWLVSLLDLPWDQPVTERFEGWDK